jgi:hypothetical protein
LEKDSYGWEIMVIDCAVQWSSSVSRCVEEVAEVCVVGFDINIVHVEEVFYHRYRFGWVFAFGGTVQ